MVLIDVATINPFDNSHARDVFDAGSDRRIPAFLRTGKTRRRRFARIANICTASSRHELNRCGSTVIRADSSETYVPGIRTDGIRIPISLHTQSAQSTVLTHLGRQSMNHIALSRNDFNTLDPIHIETGAGHRCSRYASSLPWHLSSWWYGCRKPTLKPTKKTNRGRHDASTGTSIWHERITDVVVRHAHVRSRKEEGSVQPCSHRSPEISVSTATEAATCAIRRSPDIEATPRTTGNQHGSPCSGRPSRPLYPPEFADAETQSHGQRGHG